MSLLLEWGLRTAVAGEPIDTRGMWVADTVSEPHRPVRLVYPDAGTGWDAGLITDVARQPLTETGLDGTPVPVVDVLSSAHLFGGVSWRGRRFSLAAPITVYGQDLSGGFAGLGDVQLSVLQPVIVPTDRKLGVALAASGWIPTGDQDRWSGSPGLAAGAVASMGQELGRFGWVANVGMRAGQSTAVRNVLSGPGPIAGVEIHTRLRPDLVIGVEAVSQGSTGFSSIPVEVGGAARYRHKTGAFANIGVAYGITDGVGASGGRITLGIGYSGGRTLPGPPPEPVVVPLIVSQRRSEVRIEQPVAELVDNRIILHQQIFFEEGQATLLEDSEAVLAAVLEILGAHEDITHLLIEGHTNARGSRGDNQRLSELRADAVASWLSDNGVDQKMLLTRGFGEDRPLVADEDPNAMILNRRVEFIVLRADMPDNPRIPSLDDLPASVLPEE
ncbi:MAG: OmpA family protein [Myxococcota bacterium]